MQQHGGSGNRAPWYVVFVTSGSGVGLHWIGLKVHCVHSAERATHSQSTRLLSTCYIIMIYRLLLSAMYVAFFISLWSIILGSCMMPTVGDSSFIHRLDVDIVTPTYTGTDSLGSRTYIDPAYTTGLEVLRQTWPQFNVSHRFLMSDLTNCSDEKAEVQDTLSRWYYWERTSDSVPVILTCGNILTIQLIANTYGIRTEAY